MGFISLFVTGCFSLEQERMTIWMTGRVKSVQQSALFADIAQFILMNARP